MTTLRLLVALLFVALPSAYAAGAQLTIRVALVDKELNIKPVPKLVLVLTPTAGGAPVSVTTGFDGMAHADLPVGKYSLATPQPVQFGAMQYSWGGTVDIKDVPARLELSNDNALAHAAPAEAAATVGDLSEHFKRLKHNVVRVWSEAGQGSGFIVDPDGLIVTNAHIVPDDDYLDQERYVIGVPRAGTRYVAAQFDDIHKVSAVVLAVDRQRDLAVLWANLSAAPNPLVALLKPAAMAINEGDRVFTIGNPLKATNVLTAGVISGIGPVFLASDVNINSGSSGAPLYNLAGHVIGVTTFHEGTPNQPGLSGVVRIEQALPLIQAARQKMAGRPAPPATLLPVEPIDLFPEQALHNAVQGAFDTRPYNVDSGNYTVRLITPVYAYYAATQGSMNAVKHEQMRMGASKEEQANAVANALQNSPAYASVYRPVLIVQALPKVQSSTMSMKVAFRTDFGHMRLLCGSREVEPIHRFRSRQQVSVQFVQTFGAGPLAPRRSVAASDATYVGVYWYEPDAITPACGDVTLELYSNEHPDKPVRKTLDRKTMQRVWSDFEPYRALRPLHQVAGTPMN